jgi:general secretion pathway protein F
LQGKKLFVAVFEYKGITASGKSVRGIVNADSPRAARQKLRGEGVYPTELVQERVFKSKISREVSLRQLFTYISKQDIAIMTRQLATLLRAGLPLVSCLNALADQIDNQKLKKIVTQVKERVNEGSSLAAALQEFPRVFPDLYTNMVGAGETSGALELVLLRLADYTENQVQIRNRLLGAMIYPALMTVVGFVVLTILFTFVIPKFITIFEELGQALPTPTLVLIAVTTFVKSYWFVIVLLAGGCLYGLRRYVRTPAGRQVYDRTLLRVPVIGRLVRLSAVVRFARTLSTLLTSGVPLLKALDIVQTVVNNAVFAETIRSARDFITEGASIAEPLKRSKVFPPIVIHMIASGEQSGQLEEMLAKVADIYEEEVQVSVTALTSLLEPLMILGMALVVAFIVISILLPLLEMNQIVGR